MSNTSESVRKCARAGCENHRYEGSEFCLSCRTKGRHLMAERTTCDDLPALPERDYHDILREELGAFKKKWSGKGL